MSRPILIDGWEMIGLFSVHDRVGTVRFGREAKIEAATVETPNASLARGPHDQDQMVTSDSAF